MKKTDVTTGVLKMLESLIGKFSGKTIPNKYNYALVRVSSNNKKRPF